VSFSIGIYYASGRREYLRFVSPAAVPITRTTIHSLSIGYDRLDSVEQTILLNRIYEKLWIYHNLFLPLRRTVDKESIPLEGRGYKVKRIHDESRTPLQRAEEKEVIEARRLEMLKRLRDTTNPLRLRDEIYQLIDELFRLPGASKGEDVYKTLNLKPTLPKEVLSSLERVLQ